MIILMIDNDRSCTTHHAILRRNVTTMSVMVIFDLWWLLCMMMIRTLTWSSYTVIMTITILRIDAAAGSGCTLFRYVHMGKMHKKANFVPAEYFRAVVERNRVVYRKYFLKPFKGIITWAAGPFTSSPTVGNPLHKDQSAKKEKTSNKKMLPAKKVNGKTKK